MTDSRTAAGPPASLRGLLSRRALASLLLNLSATGLLVLATLVLAQASEPAQLGRFASVVALVAILAIPAVAGFDRLLIRTIPAQMAAGRPALVLGLITRTRDLTALVGITIAAGGVGLAFLLVEDPAARLPLSLGLLSLPLISLSRIRQAVLYGLEQIVLGQLPESLVRPGLLLAGAASLWLLLGTRLDAAAMVALHLVSTLAAFTVGWLLLQRHLPDEVTSQRPVYETRDWLRQSVALTVLAGGSALMLQAPVVLVDVLNGPDEAAIFAVASRVALLVPLALSAANLALGPTVARLWAAGERCRLERMMVLGSRAVLITSLPLALALLLLSREVLGLFGDPYMAGADALRVLAVGQLINVATGFVGLLLIMTGHSTRAALSQLFIAAALIPTTVVLAAMLGALGAALASSAALVAVNGLWLLHARGTVGFGGTPLGRA